MTDSRIASLQQACPCLKLKTDPPTWALRARLDPALDAGAAGDRTAGHGRGGTGGDALECRRGRGGGAVGRPHRPLGWRVAANGELVLSLERMNRALDYDAVDRTLVVQAGMPLEAVHNAALDHGLIYPVDFAARGSCTIGGNIATNAGGIRVIRYGNTREVDRRAEGGHRQWRTARAQQGPDQELQRL